MNKPQAQGSYFPRHQVPGPKTATSHLPNTFLSSSEFGNFNNTNRNSHHHSSFQDMNAIIYNFLQSCDQNVSTSRMEELFSHEHLSKLRDSNGKTLLMVAAEKGSLELVQKCLELGISINQKDNWGKNALFWAVDSENPYTFLISFLLEKGADPNNKCQNGATPLLRAVEKGRYKISEILLKKGSYSNVKYETTGETALHIAASKRDRKIVQLLLDNGSDPKKRNKKKQSVWDIAEEIPEILEILRNHQSSREDRPPIIRRINSEAIYQSGYHKDNKALEEDEDGKSDSQSHNEGLPNTPMGGPINISNLPEPPSLVLSHANRNDDNFSNASTTCSNAHSEYRFNIKNNQSFNPVNTSSEEHGRHPDRNYQQSNPKSYPNRKREDSGVSRNSLTSVHSDMASDNESMSGHSQNNVTSDYSSQYFSPELHEKTRSTGSIGNTEPHAQVFMSNVLSKHNSYPYPFVQNGSEYGGTHNHHQKRKHAKTSFHQGTKSPYQSQNNFESHQNQSYRRAEFGYSPQGEVMGQNYHYSNKRESQEYMLKPQRSYPFSNNDSQMGYHTGYNSNAIGPRGQQNYIYDNNHVNPNLMFQPNMNGAFVPIDMSNMHNSNNPMQNPYFLKPHQFVAYPHIQMPPDPLTNMFNKIHEENSQFTSPHMNQGGIQAYYQTPPRGNVSQKTQQENFAHRDPLLTFVKDAKEGQKELENEKNENSGLKAKIEASVNISKELEEKLKEKDELLQSLLKRSQEMENAIKEKDPNFIYKPRQNQSSVTDSLMRDFCPSTVQDLMTKSLPNFKNISEIAPVLHEEILSFERSINTYYQENSATFDTLIDLVKESLAQIAPEAECLIYGSFATGLGLPDSDIDIVVKIPQIQIKYACSVLEKFESCIIGQEWVEDIKTIPNKTVPILKITCSNAYLNKKIDITIQDLSHNGLSCVELVKEYLRAYPALKPLSLVLKHFLTVLNLNDTYSGGLSSYGLLLMIVNFLQLKEELAVRDTEEQNYGELLLSFLYFYGFEHDYYTHNHLAVSPKKLPKVEDPEKEKNNQTALMNMICQQQPTFIAPRIVIQDPVFSRNNIGKSTFRIREIKHAFMAAYFEAFKPCTCEIHEHMQKMEGNQEKKIQCILILKKMFLAYHPAH